MRWIGWRGNAVEMISTTHVFSIPSVRTLTITESLVESGLVEARGDGKSRSYILIAGVYRQLGQAVSYVHAKGFESEQMEQMILQYARAHGQVTRQDVMELCRINENQAVYVIKKLVNGEKLLRIRMGRNAAYQSTNSVKLGKNSGNSRINSRKSRKTGAMNYCQEFDQCWGYPGKGGYIVGARQFEHNADLYNVGERNLDDAVDRLAG